MTSQSCLFDTWKVIENPHQENALWTRLRQNISNNVDGDKTKEWLMANVIPTTTKDYL